MGIKAKMNPIPWGETPNCLPTSDLLWPIKSHNLHNPLTQRAQLELPPFHVTISAASVWPVASYLFFAPLVAIVTVVLHVLLHLWIGICFNITDVTFNIGLDKIKTMFTPVWVVWGTCYNISHGMSQLFLFSQANFNPVQSWCEHIIEWNPPHPT